MIANPGPYSRDSTWYARSPGGNVTMHADEIVGSNMFTTGYRRSGNILIKREVNKNVVVFLQNIYTGWQPLDSSKWSQFWPNYYLSTDPILSILEGQN